MPDFVTEFKKTDRRQTVANGIALVCGAIVLWLERNSISGSCEIQGGLPSRVAFFALFGAIIFGFWNWRCCACRSYLGHTGIRNGCCYKCGVPLRDKKSWRDNPWIWVFLLSFVGIVVAMLAKRG